MVSEGVQPPTLTAAEVERYSRQLLLPEMGEEEQLRLRAATVALIGCGGLGVAAAPYLAGAGVGAIRLFDPDLVEVHNLHRQVAFGEADLGAPKALALARRLRQLNPLTDVGFEVRRVGPSDLPSALAGVDLVLECTDDPRSKFGLNDWAVGSGNPAVIGGAMAMRGQVVIVLPGSPCYRCLFKTPPASAVSCQTAGVLGPLVGVIGALQALLAVEALSGTLFGAAGRLWDLDGAALRWREIRFERDPRCPSHPF